MPPLKLVLFALLIVTLVVAVATDLKSRRIPDWLTWPAMIAALGLRFGFEGVGDLTCGLLGGLAGLGAAVAWFGAFALSKQRLGWGDVKLAGVMGAVFGMPLTVSALVFVSLAGALQAVVSLLLRGKLSDTVRAESHIPYGVAIALGSLWAMWWDGNA